MNGELKLSDIVDSTTMHTSEAADLWPRIAAAHVARTRRRKSRRLIGSGVALIALIVAGAALQRLAPQPAAVDWQARAQALELQLNRTDLASDVGHPSSDAQADLDRVDRALQAAYDRGADKSELVDLWKQRSELLSVLITVRQQQLALTRI